MISNCSVLVWWLWQFGLTPLEFAALTNNLDIMRILLPATAPIPSYPDWSIHGILEHIPSVVAVWIYPKFMFSQWSIYLFIFLLFACHVLLARKVPEEQNFLICKEKGNDAFKMKNYSNALMWYTRVKFNHYLYKCAVKFADKIWNTNRLICGSRQ